MPRRLPLHLTGCVLLVCLALTLVPPAAQADPTGATPAGFDPQWNLKVIKAQRAWSITRGSSDIVVGVIDTGIDPTHSEFAGRLVPGRNFAGGNDTADTQGHGTFVAGIIAGATTGV